MPDGAGVFYVSDGMPEHPKILAAGGDAGWLQVCALGYARRNHTDGIIPANVVPRLSDRRQPARLARILVQERIWHEPGHDCAACPQPLPGTYLIHDYLDWQHGRDEEATTREAKGHGGAFGNHRRWHVARSLSDPSCQFCTSNGEASHMRSESESDDRSHMRSESDSSTDRTPNRSPNRTSDDRPSLPPHTPPSLPVDITPPTPPNGQAAKGRRKAYEYADDKDFLRFWDVFPEKSGKPAAYRAWLAAKARGADPEHVIRAAERYRNDPRRDPNHTKYPQGWLNDERYNDTAEAGNGSGFSDEDTFWES